MMVYPAQHDSRLRCREVLNQGWDNGLGIIFRISRHKKSFNYVQLATIMGFISVMILMRYLLRAFRIRAIANLAEKK